MGGLRRSRLALSRIFVARRGGRVPGVGGDALRPRGSLCRHSRARLGDGWHGASNWLAHALTFRPLALLCSNGNTVARLGLPAPRVSCVRGPSEALAGGSHDFAASGQGGEGWRQWLVKLVAGQLQLRRIAFVRARARASSGSAADLSRGMSSSLTLFQPRFDPFAATVDQAVSSAQPVSVQ